MAQAILCFKRITYHPLSTVPCPVFLDVFARSEKGLFLRTDYSGVGNTDHCGTEWFHALEHKAPHSTPLIRTGIEGFALENEGFSIPTVLSLITRSKISYKGKKAN